MKTSNSPDVFVSLLNLNAYLWIVSISSIYRYLFYLCWISLFFPAAQCEPFLDFGRCVNVLAGGWFARLIWWYRWAIQWWVRDCLAAISALSINIILSSHLVCKATRLFLIVFWRWFRGWCCFTETSLEVDILRGAGWRFCNNNQPWESFLPLIDQQTCYYVN